MNRQMFRAVLAVAAGLGLLCTTVLRADTVKMKDERSFVGKIIEETDERVVIDTMIAGIRTQMALKRPDVASITREAVPADFFAPRKTAEPPKPLTPPTATAPAFNEPPPPEPASVKADAYLEVPIVGTFGKEVTPEGVEDALDYVAKHPQIKHVVFVIDSPGGLVAAADGILEALKKHDGQVRYHALVKRAISAAIWVVFGSDTIHMTDGAALGGAVVYHRGDTGAAEVDAKMTSIVSAIVMAAAEKKGHPALLIPPMMVKDATVAAWRDAAGKVQFALSLPRDVPPQNVLLEDTRETVLTVTKEQAVRLGLAREIKGEADALGQSLGLSDWGRYNDYGAYAMRKGAALGKAEAARRRQVPERIRSLGLYITANMNEFQQNDPQHFGDYLIDRRGIFTTESRKRWVERTDAAVAALMRVQKAVTEVLDLVKQNPETQLDRILPELNLKDFQDRLGRELQRLRANRNRGGM